MPEFLILHYEDEPSKVDFPGLIEVALFQHPLVTEADIDDIDNDGQSFKITFSVGDCESELKYLIGSSINDLNGRFRLSFDNAMLYMVDMSINGDVNAGLKILNELNSKGVGNERIWFVTAYEAKVKSLIPENITVYPKPSPFSMMVAKIVNMLISD